LSQNDLLVASSDVGGKEMVAIPRAIAMGMNEASRDSRLDRDSSLG